MPLTKLESRYFRSLYEVDLAFKPITVVIGPNGSGKSNVLKALRFLYDAVAGDVSDWRRYDALIDDLPWYGVGDEGERPARIALTIEVDAAGCSLCPLRYETDFTAADYFRVGRESLTAGAAEDRSILFRREGDVIEQWINRRGRALKRAAKATARSPRNLTLRDEGPSPSFPGPEVIHREIAGWRFFEVNPRAARRASAVPEIPEEIPPLAADASNLSAFLYALYRLSAADYDSVIDATSRAIELPQKILVEHDANRADVDSPLWRGTDARYAFIETPFGENRPVPPDSISDGTIRYLAHMALLLGDPSVTLACLEEPDSGLHPRLMYHLADAMRLAVGSGDPAVEIDLPRVLITTHSPELLDCFDLAEETDYLQVYVAERGEHGETILTSVTAAEFAPWLERYRLGEAVRRHFV